MLTNGYLKIVRLNLKHYRENLGLTQQELSDRIGMSFRHYQELERGAGNPTLETLQKIATIYTLTLDRLLRLDFLRTQYSLSQLIEKLSPIYKEVTYLVTIRDLEGNLNYVNPAASQLFETSVKVGQNVFDLLPEQTKEILRIELLSEKNLFPCPYTFQIHPKDLKPVFLRAYPTLVFVGKARQPSHAIVYISNPEQDCNKNYLDFASRLMTAVHAEQ